jgi:hypothetical protein
VRAASGPVDDLCTDHSLSNAIDLCAFTIHSPFALAGETVQPLLLRVLDAALRNRSFAARTKEAVTAMDAAEAAAGAAGGGSSSSLPGGGGAEERLGLGLERDGGDGTGTGIEELFVQTALNRLHNGDGGSGVTSDGAPFFLCGPGAVQQQQKSGMTMQQLPGPLEVVNFV